MSYKELLESNLPPDREGFIEPDVNKYRTQSLFWEYRNENVTSYFTTQKRDRVIDGRLHLSLYRLYMEIADPTEYLFAQEVFQDWEQWERITKNNILAGRLRIPQWRTELELKIRSMGIQANIMEAKDGNVAAGKWLAERKWNPRKAGAPSKNEVIREMKISRQLDKETEDDLQRLGIH